MLSIICPSGQGEFDTMVYKEMLFTEYTYEGKKFQWAHLIVGKGKGNLEVLIDYTSRVCTSENFSLKMDGRTLISQQEFSDFDVVSAVIENTPIIFYAKDAGFNIAALTNQGKYMRWE